MFPLFPFFSTKKMLQVSWWPISGHLQSAQWSDHGFLEAPLLQCRPVGVQIDRLVGKSERGTSKKDIVRHWQHQETNSSKFPRLWFCFGVTWRHRNTSLPFWSLISDPTLELYSKTIPDKWFTQTLLPCQIQRLLWNIKGRSTDATNHADAE